MEKLVGVVEMTDCPASCVRVCVCVCAGACVVGRLAVRACVGASECSYFAADLPANGSNWASQ